MSGDAGARLTRAIERASAAAGCPARVVRTEARRWASATFTGARHALSLELPAGAPSERWLAALREADFEVPGHLVADLDFARIARDPHRITAALDVLTVEAR